MKISTLAKLISLPLEAYEAALAYPFTEQMKKEGKRLCTQEALFLDYCRKQHQHRLFSLRLILELAADIKDDYDALGIEERVYKDTFYDITLWCQNCYATFHEWGIDEVIWLRLHICMEVFRLGRLAFQKIHLTKDIPAYHKKQGDEVIEIHVAQGEALVYEDCIRSLNQALSFYHMEGAWFWGESWLLHPALQKMLTKDCNILRFQSLFHIYEIDESCHQGEERIFGDVMDIADYPETTSLQRNLKQYLLKGNTLGMARGIFYYHR